jgi:2-dehydropantoate 2-reductase
MRIAIYGVGGVGGFFGAQLIRAGEEVVFIARGAHLEAIRENGLCVSSPKGEMLVQPSLATADLAEIGPVDVVILGVKAEQVSGVAESIGPLLGAETFVLPLQNGVEAADKLRSILGGEHVIVGLCGMMSWVAGPGHIRTLGDVNFIKFGEANNRFTDRIDQLRAAFERAGVRSEIPDDINRALWEKFLFVASLGGVGAVKDAPFGVIREEKGSRRMLELAMHEIYRLALARGIALDEATVSNTLAFVDTLPADGTTSLHRDIVDGKPSELESWNGAVVRLARQATVDVPVHTFIYESLLPGELASRAAFRL